MILNQPDSVHKDQCVRPPAGTVRIQSTLFCRKPTGRLKLYVQTACLFAHNRLGVIHNRAACAYPPRLSGHSALRRLALLLRHLARFARAIAALGAFVLALLPLFLLRRCQHLENRMAFFQLLHL